MNSLIYALFFAFAPLVQNTTPTPAQTPRGAPAEADLAPFEALASDIQSAVENDDARTFNACFDLNPLFEKSTAGVDANPEFRKGFCKGLNTTLLPTLLKSVRDVLEGGGGFRLLRIRTRDSEQLLLFRILLPEDGGVEYLEFTSSLGRDGKARARDWYLYTNGEWVSETLHRLYLPFAIESERGLLERMLGKDQQMVKHWGEVKRILECLSKGRGEEGLKLCSALPEELRRDKFILLQRLRLTQAAANDAEYAKVLEDLRRFHPNDPANELHAIDFFYMRKDWAQAADAVRRLRKGIAGDPFLDYLESSLLLQAEDLVGARKSIERSIAEEPDFLSAHWILVTIAMKQKDNRAVLAALKVIDVGFEMEWEDLAQVDEYKEFAASKEFEEWKRYLAKK